MMRENIASSLHLVFSALILLISGEFLSASDAEPGAGEPRGSAGVTTSELRNHTRAESGVKNQLDVFFSARRHSELEPCGCIKKQLGGVQYEATVYREEGNGAELRLEVGDWTVLNVNKDPAASMKTRYLVESFHLLGLDAVNIGTSDAANPLEFFESIGDRIPEIWEFLVSANVFLKSDPHQPAFSTHRIVERELIGGRRVRIGITGACLNQRLPIQKEPRAGSRDEFEIGDFIIKPPVEHLKPVLDILAAEVDLVILLFSGDNDSAIRLAEKFNTIAFLITTAELTQEAQDYVFNNTRLYPARFDQGKRLGKLTLTGSDTGEWIPDESANKLDVWSKLDADPVLQEMVDTWKAITAGLELPRPDKPDLLYAGSHRCGLCHEAETKDWKTTGHAGALDTLTLKGRQYDSECQNCHTTGFRHENGFWGISDRESRFFFGVQCESCHGPAKIHADAEQQIRSGSEKWMDPEEFKKLAAKAKSHIPSASVDEQTCLKCHTPENDDHFIYAEKIHHVNHSGMN
jgi:hypothetical protein